uniref:Uncharacterized protein n=1 Tax=Cacopsylla melanoneura TaxID=428564 RepID=A0A8D8XTG6_9HEMI
MKRLYNSGERAFPPDNICPFFPKQLYSRIFSLGLPSLIRVCDQLPFIMRGKSSRLPASYLTTSTSTSSRCNPPTRLVSIKASTFTFDFGKPEFWNIINIAIKNQLQLNMVK